MCVETLKRDWSSTLKLRDVLVTISCLLIQPNPASALNEAAGKLANEDWDSYCRRAKLMTAIHAAIPSTIIDQVQEAQSRGDEKEVVAEARAVEAKAAEAKAVETKLNGKGKAKATPTTATKVRPSSTEDEENLRQGDTNFKPDSDPEDDWIPGPIKSLKTAHVGRSNIFGIQGLDNGMQLGSPERPRVTRSFPQIDDSSVSEEKENDDSDPFIQDPWKRIAQQSFSLRLPAEAKSAPEVADTPELLKFAGKNPFSVIQPNNQTHPLLREFSWTWEESEIMHETGFIKNGESKTNVRKRLASDAFEQKRTWELKKFKKAGYDLKKYNRGEFGPRTGIRRL